MGKYDGAINFNPDKDRIAYEDAKAVNSNGKGSTPRTYSQKFRNNLSNLKGFSWSNESGHLDKNSDS